MISNGDDVFRSFPILETERLVLRQIRLQDAKALLECFADDEVTRFYNLDSFDSISQARDLISGMAHRYLNHEAIRWGITRKGEDSVLGTCGYTSWNQAFHQAEIGYELARPFWRKGIMSETLKAVLQFGFSTMDLNRVSALVMPGNVSSMRLLEQLRFQYEGTLREYGFWKGDYHDLQSYSLLRREAPWLA